MGTGSNGRSREKRDDTGHGSTDIAHPAACRRDSALALQQELGLCAERRLWAGASCCRSPAFPGSHLRRLSQCQAACATWIVREVLARKSPEFGVGIT